MYENICNILFLFPMLVYTVLSCDPKDAISLEQENKFRNAAPSWDVMQTASSDALSFACKPDDLECKKMQLRMPTDVNEQDRQRKRCDTCLKSYRCAKLRKCEPCEKICGNDVMGNVGSINKIDEYSAYFTLGEFGPGFQMDQIVDFIGLPERDKYEKVVVIGKTKDQNGLKKCKALIIDPVESFKDIKEAKCAGIALKKTETEQKLVAPSNIQDYIETAENHLIAEIGTEKPITVSKDIPMIENILKSDFMENTPMGLNNDFNESTQSSEKKLIKSSLKKGSLRFKGNSDEPLMESITDTNSTQNSDSLKLLHRMKDSSYFPTADENVKIDENFKSQLSSLSSSELKPSENQTFPYDLNQNLTSPFNLSTTHQSKSQQHMSTRLLPRKHNRVRPNSNPYRHRVSSILSENNSSIEEMPIKENKNLLQSEGMSPSNESYLEINERFKDEDLLEKKANEMVTGDRKQPLESNMDPQVEYSSSNEVPSQISRAFKKIKRPIQSRNSSNNEKTLKSIVMMPKDKLLAPLEITESSENHESTTFDVVTKLPKTIGKVTEIVQDATDRVFFEKSSTADFLQEEYRDIHQLQRLYVTTPKTDTIKKNWKEEYLYTTKNTFAESNESTSFDDDTNAVDESENQTIRTEVKNKDKLKLLKESKVTEKVLAVPKAHKNINRDQSDVLEHPYGTQKTISTKFTNLETQDSFPDSKEVRLQSENIESDFSQFTDKTNDSLDSFTNQPETDNDAFLEPNATTAFSEHTKEETLSKEADYKSNVNKESNIILTSSESRIIKQKHLPILKSKLYSPLKQELHTGQNILTKPNSNITYLVLEGEKSKLISSNQIKDKVDESSTISKNIQPSVDYEQNLDSLVDASRYDNYSTEVPSEENTFLKSIKQKLKSVNRSHKTPQNMVSAELHHRGIDTLKEPSLNSNASKPENAITNTDSEEKLKAFTHANKKLKAKHAFPTKINPNVAHAKDISDFPKTGESVPSIKQAFTNYVDDESDIVSSIPIKIESGSLENVLKAKHLDSLVQELEQLPPIIYDRALKVSSALSKLQSTSSPNKNLIQPLSTKKLQVDESKMDFVETNAEDFNSNSNPVEFQINGDENYKNLDESFETTEEASPYLKSIESKSDKILSFEGNIQSKEMKLANKFKEDTFDLNTPLKDAEASNEKPIKVGKEESSTRKKFDKKLKRKFDDMTVQNSQKKKEKDNQIVSESLQSIYSTKAVSDEVGNSNPEIISKENIFKNFGRVIPNIQEYPLKTNSLTDNLLFHGNDIHLPLNAKKNEDGSYKLSLDIQKLCDCKELSCIKHTPETVEEKRNVRGASHTNSDAAAQDKFTAFSDFLGQLRKISKPSSHSEFSKSQYNNEILKLISSIRPSHDT